MQSLNWLINIAQRAGAIRLVVNGSFVTDKIEPNDVDCVLMIDESFPADEIAESELIAGLPFINVELVDQDAFEQFTRRIFATDRNSISKGMLEVKL